MSPNYIYIYIYIYIYMHVCMYVCISGLKGSFTHCMLSFMGVVGHQI